MGAANRGSPLSMAASALTLRPAAARRYRRGDGDRALAGLRALRRPLGGGRASRDARFAVPRLPARRWRNGRDRGLRHPARPRRRPRQPLSQARRGRPPRTGAGRGVSRASFSTKGSGRLGAERFYLDCFADNARAQAAYLKLGFSRDGVLRKAYRLRDGTRADLVLMAILKSEWEGRRQSTI